MIANRLLEKRQAIVLHGNEAALAATHIHFADRLPKRRIHYQLLRCGVPVQTVAGQPNQTEHLIDWEHPENNDFVLAEEVILKHSSRPSN